MSVRSAVVLIVALGACRPTGPGLQDDQPDAGPFATELGCPVPGSLPFVPRDRDWQVEANEAESEKQTRLKHEPADVLTTPTVGAAYTDVPGDTALESGNIKVRGVMARIENDRGLATDAIPDEFVSVWSYDEASSWTELGQQTSGAFGTPVPGGFEFETPTTTLGGADSQIYYSVLNAEGSCGRHYIYELAAGRQVIISDIDATLTQTDEEILLQIPDGNYDPLRMTSSVEMTNAWADKGYVIIYLTARPHLFRSETRFWLEKHGYPDGPMISASDFVFDDSARSYKRAWVNRVITDLGWDVVAAYGNATSDIDAYEDAGIDKATTFIVGPNAGASGTMPIDDQDYATHITDYVNQQPSANHL